MNIERPIRQRALAETLNGKDKETEVGGQMSEVGKTATKHPRTAEP